MILFINGAFGVGKTSCAQRVAARIPNGLLYDPEEVGFMLGRILKPAGLNGDFQDYAPWRPLVASVAHELQKAYGVSLIVPMTIWRRDYFAEVMAGLRRVDAELYHFCLTAPLATIEARLQGRAKAEARPVDEWALQQAVKCVSAFQSPAFDERIDATHKSPDEIAQLICERVPASP